MDPTTQRFLRQLLLHRYATLIQTICKSFELTDIQKKQLEDAILHLEWIDSFHGG